MEEEKKEKKVPRSKYEALEKECEGYKKDSEHWKNEYFKAYADMQNLRKALEKERHDVIKYRSLGFVENLLPILESFHLALSQEVSDPVLKNYLLGFQYVYKQFLEVLDNEGVKHIEPKVGDMFDLNTMSAQEAIDSELPKDTILKVISNGFKLHDRLITPAKVVVSKGNEEEVKTEQKEENIDTNNQA